MTVVAFDGSQPKRPVGCYTYTVADGQWSWTDEVYMLHGYAPREVPATTEVLLRHKHPDDRARAFAVLETAVEDGEPFSCYHRIIDRNQQVRFVVSVGRGVSNAEGQIEKVDGFFIDLTEVRRNETQAEVETALVRIAEHREAIDEAKGMVMLALGCDADTAFGALRSHSQNINMKVHEIAHRLVEAVGPQLPGSDQVMQFLDGLNAERNSRQRRNLILTQND